MLIWEHPTFSAKHNTALIDCNGIHSAVIGFGVLSRVCCVGGGAAVTASGICWQTTQSEEEVNNMNMHDYGAAIVIVLSIPSSSSRSPHPTLVHWLDIEHLNQICSSHSTLYVQCTRVDRLQSTQSGVCTIVAGADLPHCMSFAWVTLSSRYKVTQWIEVGNLFSVSIAHIFPRQKKKGLDRIMKLYWVTLLSLLHNQAAMWLEMWTELN